MKFLDYLFHGKELKAIGNYFKMLNGYSPTFTSFSGGVYEMDLTRTAINNFATHCSKLKPEIEGSALKSLEKTLQHKPNYFMDTTKFIKRLATYVAVEHTAFIIPIEDEYGRLCGWYPLRAERCEVVESEGQLYLRYLFANGSYGAIEFERVGIMTDFEYKDDLFGEDNSTLAPTMQLIHTQNEGIINAVKNSANIRFLAKGKMKKAYRNGSFVMNQSTFDTGIDGMEDKNGQPIGRTNYGVNGEETYRFMGKNVETVEDDVLPSWDDANEGDVIAVFMNFSDYVINTNMEMQVVKWTDHDNNWSRKQALLNHAKQAGVSIADLNMQLGFLWEELQGYTAVMDALKKAGSVRAASDAVLTGYEKPADQSETVKKKRAEYGEGYYKKYAAGNGTKYYRVRKSWTDAASQLGAFTSLENAKSACKAGYTVYDDNGKAVYTAAGQQASAGVPFSVQVDILDLNIRTGAGTNYAKTGETTGKGVFTIVEVKAGQGASVGWGRLKSGAGWISLDYATRLA